MNRVQMCVLYISGNEYYTAETYTPEGEYDRERAEAACEYERDYLLEYMADNGAEMPDVEIAWEWQYI